MAGAVRTVVTEQRDVVIYTEDDREFHPAFERELTANEPLAENASRPVFPPNSSARVREGDRGEWKTAELSWANSMTENGMMDGWETVAVEKIEMVSNE